ncbi:class I SAM-dependent methyltransferase [Aestuariivivens sediminicola]|uniref:class I SAM-dependent methyltransferase n=1 Tax=Aestuariivivens sediminicola TaxID=2913560 RepID=UPI001F573B20|nr:class I SAM-dependent methyltransferase [Aestuariivivens sediminicola]
MSRTRLIPFAMEYFGLKEIKEKILHVAPNLNEYKYLLRAKGEHIIYDRLNIHPKKHINLVQDLTRTNLNTNYYDLIIAWHVFEHIREDQKAIAEVFRILKPGGRFLISVPIYPTNNPTTFEDLTIPYENYSKVHGHYDHCRSCGFDYYQRFETIGFKTKELRVSSLSKKDISKFGLNSAHIVWCFTK